MIEIQCTSCHTRYRIDERVLPEDTPTFKCSRCGHVFTADPLALRPRKAAVARAERPAAAAAPEAASRSDAKSGSATAGDAAPRSGVASRAAAEDAQDAELVVRRPQMRPSRDQRGAAVAPRPEAAAGNVEDTAPRYETRRTPARDLEAETPASAPAAAASVKRAAAADDPFARLERSFERNTEAADAGENLAFDFSQESAGPVHEPEADEDFRPPDDDRWEVGEPQPEPERARKRRRPILSIEEPDPIMEGDDFGQPQASDAVERTYVPDPDVAYVTNSGSLHKSGTFLLLFFIFAVGFGVVSMVICGAPAASARLLGELPVMREHLERPIVPAMLVALSGVQAEYRTLKGGHRALVITGSAQNVGSHPLHVVQVAVDLLDGTQRELAGQASFCGNSLSSKMIGEMTPREIEFLQRLDPQKNFALQPDKSAPILLIFIDPPAQVAKLRISVTKAEPVAPAAPAEPGA